MDVLTDSQMAQAPWPIPESRVHLGFLLAYMSARHTVQTALQRLLVSTAEDYDVVFVGHSLGAAQAVLAYVDFCMKDEGGCRRARLVTFGAPRVGNRRFAQLVNSLESASMSLRVVHGSDIVPQLPLPRGQYVHGDCEVWVKGEGEKDEGSELIVCNPSPEGGAEEDAACSGSTHMWQWSVQDHLEYPGIKIEVF
ncbi:hypothetical protein GGI21_004868 [Coemansia aciculifera]|nr:hypothetical protein GGI21_004868 [Coemansia aciculifera]